MRFCDEIDPAHNSLRSSSSSSNLSRSLSAHRMRAQRVSQLPQQQPHRHCHHRGSSRRDCRVVVSTTPSAAAAAAADGGPSTSGRVLDYTPTPDPPLVFVDPKLPAIDPWVRPVPDTYTPPSVRASGTLRPAAEWYPAWMRYRQREDNYVFWQDKFSRCSIDIPAIEKRWTLFSSLWYLWQELRFFGIPPAVRYLAHLVWRAVLSRAYETHKLLVLWQAKVDAGLASRATGGAVTTFSRAMALRRLHWKNSLLGELLYLLNVGKTGRVHLLPPRKQAPKRPTFFFLF